MTEKLFYKDNHLKTFTANVISCESYQNKFAVALDLTCFYPEGGGQPSDTGKLNGADISFVFEKNGVIFHVCETAFQKGETVKGEVDFGKRFQYMQTHTAEHILSGYLKTYYNFNNVGFHIGTDSNTIDIDNEIDEKIVLESELFVNERIYENITVTTNCPSKEDFEKIILRKPKQYQENLRVVFIDSCDTCACCGIHVGRTGEIGIFKITDFKRYKKGTRITFICGRRALDDYSLKNAIVKTISAKLSSSSENILFNLEKHFKDFDNLKFENSKLHKEKCAVMAKQLSKESAGDRLCEFLENMSFESLKFLALEITKIRPLTVLLVSQTKETDMMYVLAKSEEVNLDLKKICDGLNKKFDGKGGGNAVLCQGSVAKVNFEEIKIFFG